ncbi:uncharacterized protein LOC121781302 [Salvia splendens]|uniref:uncharacterized protein LOC121781302 n=1 Tax=Salvia splendens TaxID=180675 RepID=UPI001C25442E|nr:uncharacterized protein LOC121781302 [Salvia splendens]
MTRHLNSSPRSAGRGHVFPLKLRRHHLKQARMMMIPRVLQQTLYQVFHRMGDLDVLFHLGRRVISWAVDHLDLCMRELLITGTTNDLDEDEDDDSTDDDDMDDLRFSGARLAAPDRRHRPPGQRARLFAHRMTGRLRGQGR